MLQKDSHSICGRGYAPYASPLNSFYTPILLLSASSRLLSAQLAPFP